jgi:ubiquinone/menaquinone biosynthesis C-methylase UbiE
MSQLIAERVAQLYDASVPDWPGEIDFYRELVTEAKSNGGAVLEVACGTGRVATRLTQDAVRVVGIDLSTEMLEIAREKSAELPYVRWVQGDMKSFELGQTFGLVIIPGHSFQFMLTPEDQIACLECIKRHLVPGGMLVVHLDHQDISWLGDLRVEKGGVFEMAEELTHPKTGRLIRTSRAWSYEPSTQTASAVTVWEEIGTDGKVVDRWEMGPIRMHCVFRFEMEHLLARVGFEVEALYGDFFRRELQDESTEMIWVVRNRQTNG